MNFNESTDASLPLVFGRNIINKRCFTFQLNKSSHDKIATCGIAGFSQYFTLNV